MDELFLQIGKVSRWERCPYIIKYAVTLLSSSNIGVLL